MMELVNGVVTGHEKITSREYILQLHVPSIAQSAVPGQFVMIQTAKGIEPFLRKPISIHDVDGATGDVRFYYQVVGKGTEALTHVGLGEEVSLLGPLGNGFRVVSDQLVYVVGGGIGQGPLLYLCRQLVAQGNRVVVVMGARDASGLKALAAYERLGVTLQLATEDGSLGYKGFVTGHMDDLTGVGQIYACGPEPMLAAIQRVASTAGVPAQLSLEAKMACGVGVCLGCTCKSSDPQATSYPKVCTDGPVFAAEEVAFS